MKKLEKIEGENKINNFTMPLSLRILKTAVSYNISSDLIKSLHFYDLQSMLFSITSDKIIEKIEMHNQKRMKDKGIDTIKKVSGKDILKFL